MPLPSPEPGPLDPGDGPLPSDDLLGLLYRSGQYDGDDPQIRGAAIDELLGRRDQWASLRRTGRDFVEREPDSVFGRCRI